MYVPNSILVLRIWVVVDDDFSERGEKVPVARLGQGLRDDLLRSQESPDHGCSCGPRRCCGDSVVGLLDRLPLLSITSVREVPRWDGIK